ncbi:hypothetical protein GOODEAATRI_015541 [Goodea atripinnis]|uniref:Secreted protein n=1 Tax=Goodea atripinnis TaxID=208336 RepID=A0ABV0P4D8_9TELE
MASWEVCTLGRCFCSTRARAAAPALCAPSLGAYRLCLELELHGAAAAKRCKTGTTRQLMLMLRTPTGVFDRGESSVLNYFLHVVFIHNCYLRLRSTS